MVLASGGIFVELARDSRALLLPTDREGVSEALASLKVSELLDGFRGRPSGDRAAVVDIVLTIAGFAEAHRDELSELDINPLMVLPEGVVAADVLLRMAAPGDGADESH